MTSLSHPAPASLTLPLSKAEGAHCDDFHTCMCFCKFSSAKMEENSFACVLPSIVELLGSKLQQGVVLAWRQEFQANKLCGKPQSPRNLFSRRWLIFGGLKLIDEHLQSANKILSCLAKVDPVSQMLNHGSPGDSQHNTEDHTGKIQPIPAVSAVNDCSRNDVCRDDRQPCCATYSSGFDAVSDGHRSLIAAAAPLGKVHIGRAV